MPYGKIAYVGQMILGDGVTMENASAFIDLNNSIYFCGDAQLENYSPTNPIFTLPDEMMFPDSTLYLPICVTDDTGTRIAPMKITPSGEGFLPFEYTSATVHLNGWQFTANGKYYTSEIGNVYPNNTSPLA